MIYLSIPVFQNLVSKFCSLTLVGQEFYDLKGQLRNCIMLQVSTVLHCSMTGRIKKLSDPFVAERLTPFVTDLAVFFVNNLAAGSFG